MGFTKASDSKSDMQTHSVTCNCVIQKAIYDFVLIAHCNHVSILHHYWDITTYFPKFKDVTWP